LNFLLLNLCELLIHDRYRWKINTDIVENEKFFQAAINNYFVGQEFNAWQSIIKLKIARLLEPGQCSSAVVPGFTFTQRLLQTVGQQGANLFFSLRDC
jgi:hypothetical protein